MNKIIPPRTIAYFPDEIGLESEVPTYSDGLRTPTDDTTS
jgi:hypothetical protein